jgi:hypothetical protein
MSEKKFAAGLLVRAASSQAAGMKKPSMKLARITRELQRDPRRSSLFHWLLDRASALAPVLQDRRPNWAVLRDRVVNAGVTDGHGKPPSTRIVRLTWRSVEREILRLAETQQRAAIVTTAKRRDPRRVYPPPDWRPPDMSAVHPAPTLQPSVVPALSENGTGPPPSQSRSIVSPLTAERTVADMTAEEQIEAVRKVLRKQDRWMR